jgi:hypothetical protein
MSEERIELGFKAPLEREARDELNRLMTNSGIPAEERLETLPVFLKRQEMARILFLNELYQQILEIPGSIVQCGVRWGGDVTTLTSLRGLYEPYNYSRRIIGFDTFSGLAGVNEKDQGISEVLDGQFAVTEGYQDTLSSILKMHESMAPLPHICKHALVVGDARNTVPQFLQQNPGEAIALLYLDMDIYDPTKVVLEQCIARMPSGAIVVFDEFGDRRFPGEAAAYFELSGKVKLKLKRTAFNTVTAYGVVQ